MTPRKIGVLALQGAFIEHEKALESLGCAVFEIRQLADWERNASSCSGLVIPGGESTVISKLLRELNLFEPLKGAIKSGLPVLGTCAGMILLASRISETGAAKADGDCSLAQFGAIEMTAQRNAYGRQLGSFQASETFAGKRIPMVFIRAPYAVTVGPDVEVLAQHEGKIIAARQGNAIATAFHPELTSDLSVHEMFLGV